jgi:hypothetical protein
VLKGETVVDVTDVVRDIPHLAPHDLMAGLIADFDNRRKALESAVERGSGKAVSQVKIRPPLPKPYTIACMAVNYMEDGTRAEPAPINAFLKSASAIIGDGDTMILPDVPSPIFEGEAEMAGIIGKHASNVSAADAMSYIFGYTNFIDGSARGLPPSGNTFYQMKAREGARHLRAHWSVHRHRRRDCRPAQAAGAAVDQRQTRPELQHQRHGPQDCAVCGVGFFHTQHGARRHPGVRHQPPRLAPAAGWRPGGDRNPRVWAGCTSRFATT